MASVYRKDDESLDGLYRRFKRAVTREGIIMEYRKRRYFEKPSDKRRRKHNEVLRRRGRSSVR